MSSGSPQAVVKQEFADWQVKEHLRTAFTGAGEHCYFFVEKQDRNTEDVAQALARAHGLPRVSVGYAGRKDKRGITQQWFSVATEKNEWPEVDGTRCLNVERHSHKLRIGDVWRNEFNITLRECQHISHELLLEANAGFANKYGIQRLSSDNVEQAERWLSKSLATRNDRKKRNDRSGDVSRGQKGWHLSVLRSLVFNKVADYRIESGQISKFVDGDVIVAGFPSAPLWGRGRSRTAREALEVEQAAIAPVKTVCEQLEFSGAQQGRRALYARPENLVVQETEDGLFTLSFQLPAGVYATSMLDSLMTIREDKVFV